MCSVLHIHNLYYQDAMVDITAFGEEMGEPYPKTYKAHKGMLKSARNLAERLKRDSLLANAFTGQVGTYMMTSPQGHGALAVDLDRKSCDLP